MRTDHQKFAAMIVAATVRAEQAYEDCVPQPVRFYPAGTDPDVTGETVEDGLCGFAWVRIAPATSKFARWLKTLETDKFRLHKGYPSGLEIWPANVSQSWERKKAWAKAFAEVLAEYGIKAYPGDRLD